jgi:hypothetical protein
LCHKGAGRETACDKQCKTFFHVGGFMRIPVLVSPPVSGACLQDKNAHAI